MRNGVEGHWEAIASRFLQETGGGPTADSFVLAACCDLQLHPRQREGALLRGRDVFYDGTQPLSKQRALVAECVARWVLRREGVVATPAAITRVAAFLTGKKPLVRALSLGVLVHLAATGCTHL